MAAIWSEVKAATWLVVSAAISAGVIPANCDVDRPAISDVPNASSCASFSTDSWAALNWVWPLDRLAI